MNAIFIRSVGYVKNNAASKAIDLFHEIENPNEVIQLLLLNACAQLQTNRALALVKKISVNFSLSDASNPRLLTSLLDALMKCGDVQSAESVFTRLTKKSLQMCAAMMTGNNHSSFWILLFLMTFHSSGYVKNDQARKAVDLFHRIENLDDGIIKLSVHPNPQLQLDTTLTLVNRMSSNPHLVTSLLDALIKCGDFVRAETIFAQLERSVISYGCLMSGYNHNDQPEKTFKLFDRMKTESVQPNSVIYLCVIKALARLGDASLARMTVDQMPKTHLENDWIRNALIDMWVSRNRPQVLSARRLNDTELPRVKLVVSIVQVKSSEGSPNRISLDSTPWVCSALIIASLLSSI